jgi:hypothetical protein
MDQPRNEQDDEHYVDAEDDESQSRPNSELDPTRPHRKGMTEGSQPARASSAALWPARITDGNRLVSV